MVPLGLRLCTGFVGFRPALLFPSEVHACLAHILSTGDMRLEGSWPPTAGQPVPALTAPMPQLFVLRGALVEAARLLANGDQCLYRHELRRLEHNASKAPTAHDLGPRVPLNPAQKAIFRSLTCCRCHRTFTANQLVTQLRHPCRGEADLVLPPPHKVRARRNT